VVAALRAKELMRYKVNITIRILRAGATCDDIKAIVEVTIGFATSVGKVLRTSGRTATVVCPIRIRGNITPKAATSRIVSTGSDVWH
jgi:uncharacterized UPF0146 family protein